MTNKYYFYMYPFLPAYFVGGINMYLFQPVFFRAEFTCGHKSDSTYLKYLYNLHRELYV